MIYIIGGVARSGKTSIRKYLLNKYNISGIETDSLRTTLELSFPELKIHYDNPPLVNAERMFAFMKAFIRSRIFFEEDFVIEGDCIVPEMLEEFKKNEHIKALFLAYPNITVEDKFRQLNLNREGWLKNINTNKLMEKTRQFVEDSKIIEERCKLINTTFLDVSNLSIEETIGQSINLLLS